MIPGLLRRALRAAHIDREVEPLLGFIPSLLLGAAGDHRRGRRWPARCRCSPSTSGSLLVPGALATVVCGFLLLIGRTKAITQVCGYLILENGIYLFGLLLIELDAAAGRGGHPARPDGGGVRDRHHRRPHPARVRLARHPQTHRAARMIGAGADRRAAAGGGAGRSSGRPTARVRGCCRRRASSHAALACWLLVDPPTLWLGLGWASMPVARAVLPVVSVLFLLCAAYAVSLPAPARRAARTGCSSPRCWRCSVC